MVFFSKNHNGFRVSFRVWGYGNGNENAANFKK